MTRCYRQFVAASILTTCAMISTQTFALSINLETLARCFDDGTTQSQMGGPGLPNATCNYSVNRTGTTFGLRDRKGDIDATASAVPGFRSIGVNASAEVDLSSSRLPTVFGAEVQASAMLTDVFFMNASMPNGTPVTNGFMTINALATGMTRLDATGGGATSLSTLQLNYILSVGGAGVAANNIFMLPGDSPQNIVQPFAVVVPWTAGLALPILMQADAFIDAQLQTAGTIDALASFGNSLDWLGITNVTDQLGNPVASFTALSGDGLTDWGTTQLTPGPGPGPGPMPMSEPSVLVLFGVCLAGLGVAARRCQTSRPG